MFLRTPVLFVASWFLIACGPSVHAVSGAAERPNIVFILCDDLGYGDVRALNSQGKIPTPKMDAIARDGMVFTDAHGSSSVCTPTRYAILTGRYNWRTRMQSGVLFGYSSPLIDARRLTVASLLKKHGYATACIGKWHLGMDFAEKEKTSDDQKEGEGRNDAKFGWRFDYTKPIDNGPTTRGFDYYFGISASLDMPPFVFIENDRFTSVPTIEKTWARAIGELLDPNDTKNADGKIKGRPGPAAADFRAVDVLPTLTKKAIGYIDERAKSKEPFFLYLPLNSPHTPIVPTPQWQGKSGINEYADFVMETDDAIGKVVAALDKNGLKENTLVIVTSDNGCAPMANIPELIAHGHNPSGPLRGHKADIWDGGHRIPFIARWPQKVKAGSHSDALICLGDLMATCAEIVGEKLPDNAGEDSVSFLWALLGKPDGRPVREAIVHHSANGRFAIRDKNWKLELCPGSGGWSDPKDIPATKQGLPPIQLYDLKNDLGEQTNVQASHPEIVERLTKLLEKYVADGRSTPGVPQPNDAKIDIWKKNLDGPPRAKPKDPGD